jgi:hypothetical protein
VTVTADNAVGTSAVGTSADADGTSAVGTSADGTSAVGTSAVVISKSSAGVPTAASVVYKANPTTRMEYVRGFDQNIPEGAECSLGMCDNDSPMYKICNGVPGLIPHPGHFMHWECFKELTSSLDVGFVEQHPHGRCCPTCCNTKFPISMLPPRSAWRFYNLAGRLIVNDPEADTARDMERLARLARIAARAAAANVIIDLTVDTDEE